MKFFGELFNKFGNYSVDNLEFNKVSVILVKKLDCTFSN